MCVASAAMSTLSTGQSMGNLIANLTSGIASSAVQYQSMKQNQQYRTQVALNNAKNAQNEANRQMQLGIDKSRIEKISGLKNASKLIAMQAASGFDGSSVNSELNIQDTINQSLASSNLIEKEYKTNAQNYFKQANNYLNQAQDYQNNYNNSLFGFSYNALGKIGKVANDWFSNEGGV